ncbi:DUF481 domain-containing protein [Bacteroidota bacterium]
MTNRLVLLLTLLFLFAVNDGIAQKTDTIVHINGNILTGDLKKMVYGVASWKMDGMGTISLDEVKIRTIKSQKQFEVKMKDGAVYFGSFDSSSTAKKVVIVSNDGQQLVDIREIVEIYPIKGNFWRRMSGNFSLGLNYSKGSRVTTFTLGGNLDYRKKKTYFNLAWDYYSTYQGDSLSSTKADISLAWQRYIAHKWSTQVALGANRNTELGSKLRLMLSVIGLRDIVYNNWNRFYAGAGLAVDRETPYDTTSVTTDMTGLFQVAWKVYKYSTPKVWVDANVSFVPYITGKSRYRIVANLTPKVSIFNDNFKIGVNLYYTFDSRPPPSAASKDDYGINLELTFSLH